MKNWKLLILAFTASMPLVLTSPAWANDKNDQHEKGGKQSGGRAAHGGTEVLHSAGESHFPTNAGPTGNTRFSSGGFQRQSGRHHFTDPGTAGVTTSGISQSVVSRQNFNRSNNFGGRWSPGDAHPNWSPNRLYYWNNHQYCWFNGGWLIVDGGFWPYGYPYPYWYNPDRVYRSYYYTNDSTVVNVQEALTNMGYYNASIDGVFGPMTREAIRQYQIDNGLPANGRITRSLLYSLGLA